MTRTYSTITWGIALIVAAIALGNQQSAAWALGAAGAVPLAAGVIKAMLESDATDKVKDAEQRAKRVMS